MRLASTCCLSPEMLNTDPGRIKGLFVFKRFLIGDRRKRTPVFSSGLEESCDLEQVILNVFEPRFGNEEFRFSGPFQLYNALSLIRCSLMKLSDF